MRANRKRILGHALLIAMLSFVFALAWLMEYGIKEFVIAFVVLFTAFSVMIKLFDIAAKLINSEDEPC